MTSSKNESKQASIEQAIHEISKVLTQLGYKLTVLELAVLEGIERLPVASRRQFAEGFKLAETAALLVLSKKWRRSSKELGRMTDLEDLQVAARDILMAHSDDARLHLACEIVGSTSARCNAWRPARAW